MHADADVRELTPTTRALVAAIGYAGTYRLLRVRGGRKTYIPSSGVPERTVLRDVLGREEIEALAASEFAGRHIDLPRLEQCLLAARNREIRLTAGTLSDGQAARRWGLTTRQIRHIRRGRAPR